MTITISTIVSLLVGVLFFVLALVLYMHIRSNAGLNREQEERAKAHKIVMELARVYRSAETLRKAERLIDMRGEVLAYFDDAIQPKQSLESSGEDVAVLNFSRAKYKI